jgi:hypothetical protein
MKKEIHEDGRPYNKTESVTYRMGWILSTHRYTIETERT